MLLMLRTVLQRPHIMQTVRELDDHDADILRHRQQNLHDILRLLLLLREGRHLGELCHTLDQHRNIVSEALLHILARCGGILDDIMQQRRAECIGIHTELKQNVCNCDRMNNIRLTGRAYLSLMALRRILICRNQLADIILTVIGQNLCDDHVNRICLIMKFGHGIISSLLCHNPLARFPFCYAAFTALPLPIHRCGGSFPTRPAHASASPAA